MILNLASTSKLYFHNEFESGKVSLLFDIGTPNFAYGCITTRHVVYILDLRMTLTFDLYVGVGGNPYLFNKFILRFTPQRWLCYIKYFNLFITVNEAYRLGVAAVALAVLLLAGWILKIILKRLGMKCRLPVTGARVRVPKKR